MTRPPSNWEEYEEENDQQLLQKPDAELDSFQKIKKAELLAKQEETEQAHKDLSILNDHFHGHDDERKALQYLLIYQGSNDPESQHRYKALKKLMQETGVWDPHEWDPHAWDPHEWETHSTRETQEQREERLRKNERKKNEELKLIEKKTQQRQNFQQRVRRQAEVETFLQENLTAELERIEQDGEEEDCDTDTKLNHIENTITWLLKNELNEADTKNKQDELQLIVLYFFIGYIAVDETKIGNEQYSDWDYMRPLFWQRYIHSLDFVDETDEKKRLNKKYQEYYLTVRRFFNLTPIENESQINEQKIRNLLKDTLQQISESNFRKYYNEQKALNQKDKLKRQHKFPEFEYWIWALLESLPINLMRDELHIKRYSNHKGKPLGLITTYSYTGQIANIYAVMEYFCDTTFHQPQGKQIPAIILMIYIMFNNKLLEDFLCCIYEAVLHDPKDVRDMKETKAQVQQRHVCKKTDNQIKFQLNLALDAAKEIQAYPIVAEKVQGVFDEMALNYRKLLQRRKNIYNSFAITTVSDKQLYLQKKNLTTAATLFEQLNFVTQNDAYKRSYWNGCSVQEILIYELQQWFAKEHQNLEQGQKDNFWYDDRTFLTTLSQNRNCIRYKKNGDTDYQLTMQEFEKQMLSKTNPLLGNVYMLPWIAACLQIKICVVVANNTCKDDSEIDHDAKTREIARNNGNKNDPDNIAAISSTIEKNLGRLQESVKAPVSFRETAWLTTTHDGQAKTYNAQSPLPTVYLFWDVDQFTNLFYVLTTCTETLHIQSQQQCETEEKKRIEEAEIAAKERDQQMQEIYGQNFVETCEKTFYQEFGQKTEKTMFDKDFNYSIETKYILVRVYLQFVNFTSDLQKEIVKYHQPSYHSNDGSFLASQKHLKTVFEQNVIFNTFEWLTSKLSIKDKVENTRRSYDDADEFTKTFVEYVSTDAKSLKFASSTLQQQSLLDFINILPTEKIDVFFGIIKQIVQYWCRFFCNDEQWKKWTKCILGDEIAKNVPLFETNPEAEAIINDARAEACVIILEYMPAKSGFNNSQISVFDRRLAGITEKYKKQQKASNNQQKESTIEQGTSTRAGNNTSSVASALPVWRKEQSQREQNKMSTIHEKEEDHQQDKQGGCRKSIFPPVKGALPASHGKQHANPPANSPKAQNSQKSETVLVSGQDVTNLPDFANLLNSMMSIIQTRVQGQGKSPETTELLIQILTYLYTWIFSKEKFRKLLVSSWCEREINKYNRQPDRSILNKIFCNSSHKPNKDDFQALKVHVINITSSVWARAMGKNKAVWETWISQYIKPAIRAKTALKLIAEKNNQNFTSPVQKLVQTILLDDDTKTKFDKELNEKMIDMFKVPKPLPRKGTYKDSVQGNNEASANKDASANADQDTEDFHMIKVPDQLPDFDLQNSAQKENKAEEESSVEKEEESSVASQEESSEEENNVEQEEESSVEAEEESELIQLYESEILFRTQQDGHSLFAAITQVLYRYTAVYTTDKQYTTHSDSNVHYRHDTIEGAQLRQHINELRHAVAWMSLEYTRAAARQESWHKKEFGRLMIQSLSDMCRHFLLATNHVLLF